jgi:Outer membrane protein beta-barrel domain
MEDPMKRAFATLAALALLPLAAQADGLSYNYWELDYVNADVDDFGKNLDGFSAGVSFEITEQVFLYGSYAQADTSFSGYNVTEKDIDAGVGYAWSLLDNFDLIGRVGYVNAKLDVENFGDYSDDGYALGVGARARFIDQLEVEGGVQFADFSEIDSVTSVGVGAQWYFTPAVGVAAFVTYSDDATSYGVGVRGTWGR